MASSIEARRAYARERNAQRRARGLCVDCPNPSPVYRRCSFCRKEWAEKQRQYSKRYRRKHPEAARARAKAYYERNREAVIAQQMLRYHTRKTLAQSGASLPTSGESASLGQHASQSA